MRNERILLVVAAGRGSIDQVERTSCRILVVVALRPGRMSRALEMTGKAVRKTRVDQRIARTYVTYKYIGVSLPQWTPREKNAVCSYFETAGGSIPVVRIGDRYVYSLLLFLAVASRSGHKVHAIGEAPIRLADDRHPIDHLLIS